jgi:hypothetical protein
VKESRESLVINVLDEIGTYLQTQGIGIVNSDIFLGELPDVKKVNDKDLNIDNCIAVFETGGFEPDLTFDNDNAEYPTFQVIVRDRSYQDCAEKISSIYKLLHGNTSLFPLIIAQQPPAPIGQDDKKRWEFSVNFKVTKQM